MAEDAALIEASFAAQYGIRLSRERDMSWREFAALLSGLGADTPLGMVAAIRAEKDAKRIRGFSAWERKVYDDWRGRAAGGIEGLQAILQANFGG